MINSDLQRKARHWLLILTVAICLAVVANFGQAALSHLTGVELTSNVYACQGAGGGC